MQTEAPVLNAQARDSGENRKCELRRVDAVGDTTYNDVLEGLSCLCWFCGVPVGRARLVSGWSLPMLLCFHCASKPRVAARTPHRG